MDYFHVKKRIEKRDRGKRPGHSLMYIKKHNNYRGRKRQKLLLTPKRRGGGALI